MQHWNKGPRRKTEAACEEREDIWQVLQEDHKAGDRKANNWAIDWATGSESLDIVEGSAPFETKEDTSKAQPWEMKKC
jgi:hypothetical protein